MTSSNTYSFCFKLFLLFGLFCSNQIFGQRPCDKVVISSCIDLNTELHIKQGKIWWKWSVIGPGEDPNCPGKTTVNSKEWNDWTRPFSLNFNTDSCKATITKLQTFEISKLIQLPSAENEWETIWLFSDVKARGPNRYSISISFCSIKKSKANKAPKSKPKDSFRSASKDSIKETKSETKVTNKTTPTEDIICKVYFETNKTVLTKNSEKELSALCTSIKSNNLTIEISGYKNGSSDLKLYEERSLVIDNFLVSKGVDQKRIKYIGYGEGDKKSPSQKTIKYCIIIN